MHRVRSTALSIARAVSHDSGVSLKPPDLLTVELAARLHDILVKKYHVALSSSSSAMPSVLFSFFHTAAAQHGVDLISDGRAREVARIVENVSWTTERTLRETGSLEDWHRDCVELHCVQDADRLDAIGAFGERCLFSLPLLLL